MRPLSHTEAETYQRCSYKHYLRYELGLRPRVMAAKVEVGAWVHSLLEAYYTALKNSADPAKAVDQMHRQLLDEKWNVLFDEEKDLLNQDVQSGYELPDLAYQIAKRYIERYRKEDQAQWKKILLVEKEITVKPEWMARPFTFRCDLVVLDKHGWVRIYDHKVVKTMPDEESRVLDPQGARYVLAMHEFLRRKGVKVHGITMVYDYIRDRLPAEPALLKSGKGLSKQWIDTEPDVYLDAIKRNGFDPSEYEDILDRLRREGKPYFDRWAVPKSDVRLAYEKKLLAYLSVVTKSKSEFCPRTLDRIRCTFDCEFKEICLTELEGGDAQQIIKEKFEVVGDEARRQRAG